MDANHTHAASSFAQQHILCFCQCPWLLLTKHGICLAYGSSVGSSRRACGHPLPSAAQTPSKHGIFFSLSPYSLSSSWCVSYSTPPPHNRLQAPSLLAFLLCLNVIYFCLNTPATHIIPLFSIPYWTSYLFPKKHSFPFATWSLHMSFLPLFLSQMSHYASPLEPIEKLWKRDPVQDMRSCSEIRRQSSSVFSCTLIGCCVTPSWSEQNGERRGRAGEKAPSRPEYKEAHRDSSNMAAYHLCILCCSALDLVSFTECFAFGWRRSAVSSLAKVKTGYIFLFPF